MICSDDLVGIDAANLIPSECGGSLVSRNRVQSSSLLELGKKLLQASREGDTATVIDLMGKGALFTTDWLGTSPLHLAAMNNHTETCEILVRAGIGKDAKTKVDRTPLHFAAYEGHVDIVQLLLSHKVEVDGRDMLQMTPLHWAVERRHEECAILLVNAGADPLALSRFYKTPLSIAQEMGWTYMWELLQSTATQEATNTLQQEQHAIQAIEQNEFLQSNSDHLSNADKEDENEMDVSLPDQDTDSQNNFEDMLPAMEENTNEATMQMLKEHGIVMIPADNTNTVTSAVQSGRKVVLSDAGKLMLKECKILNEPQAPAEVKKKPVLLPTGKIKNTKIYTMSSSQFLAMTGQSKPNILSKLPDGLQNIVQLPQNTQFVNATKTSPIIKTINVNNKSPLKLTNNIKIMNPAKGKLISLKGNTLSKLPVNIKGELFNLKTLATQGKAKVIHLKNGSTLGNTVKIVVKKNNLGNLMMQKPTNAAEKSNAEKISESTENEQKNSSDIITNNANLEVDILKCQLEEARREAQEYKKRYEALQTEMNIIRNRLHLEILDAESS